ncbi:hypothetical protein C5167_020790 [Papaver somniferum]|uniref:Uncharacterized protein n=1 Tax=Papaver somniferum TaxID=3469 RepID=A0A4Y7IUJ6_PAPSO|nr:hypothetical protein C5167_020790 [Papaver somniferum]
MDGFGKKGKVTTVAVVVFSLASAVSFGWNCLNGGFMGDSADRLENATPTPLAPLSEARITASKPNAAASSTLKTST